MIQNRELTMDDYLSMLRRRAGVILIPALVAALLGYVAYLVANRRYATYTSQSTVQVEGQKVPDTMVQPVATEDPAMRFMTLIGQATSQSALKPIFQRVYGSSRSAQSIDEAIDGIESPNSKIFKVEAILDTSQAKKKPGQGGSEPAFTLSYTDSSPREAQQVLAEVTSLLLQKNLTYMQERATGTTNVLTTGLEVAKNNLELLDKNLADFKKKYVGQLPGDEENNLKILMGLNSQLESNTQTLNRAQQDKAYTESLLAQQLATWKSTQSSTNPQTLEKQLSDLQSQLLSLQARYTEDHPDMIKTKADISEVKKKLAEINKASSDAADTSADKASATEPPEIRQLRMQVHQYGALITAATADQKRLQREIAAYQGKVSLSPAVEEQYKGLTRDYDNAQKSYSDLLAKKSTADLTVKMTNQSEGERMFVLNPADVPDSPSFPNRLLFAAGGLAAGLALGGGIAMWLELRDNSIRTEADAEAALQLPMLVSVPWVGVATAPENNSKLKFWNRNKNPEEPKSKETVGV
jgi:uncharacterized protein involved in exopolysaccharide biosynthesis